MKYLFTIFERYQYIKFCYLINVSSYTTRFILWQCTICTRSINLVQQVSDIISKEPFKCLALFCCKVLMISTLITNTIQVSSTGQWYTDIPILSGVQYVLSCVFALFFFVLCTLCCQFIRIVHCWLPCRYSLFKTIQKTGEAQWQMIIWESFDVWIKLTMIISTVVVKKQQNIFISVVIIQDRVI